MQKTLDEIAGLSADWKVSLHHFKALDVKHFEITRTGGRKSKDCYLVYVAYPVFKNIEKFHRKLVVEVEKRLKALVLFTAKRTIESKWFKAHKS